jgi:hypothetical protein
MPATYEPIATYTFPSDAASYTFNSIPGTYTDLRLVIAETGATGSNECALIFNGDTGANYDLVSLSMSASNVGGSGSGANLNNISFGGGMADAVHIFEINNYKNTTVFKNCLSKTVGLGGGSQIVYFRCANWRNTAAITSIKADTYGSAFGYIWRTGTTMTLYGILAA